MQSGGNRWARRHGSGCLSTSIGPAWPVRPSRFSDTVGETLPVDANRSLFRPGRRGKTHNMKDAAKAFATALAYLCIAPSIGLYWLSGLIASPGRAFAGWSQAYSLWPGITGVYLRRAFYRLVLPRCGQGSVISFGTVFSHRHAEIGNNAY